MKTLNELLIEANEILRSVNSVIERKGAATNWDALGARVVQILEEQHKYMKSEIRDTKIEAVIKHEANN